MTPSPIYTFKKVSAADLDLLNTWHAKPHVKEWWDIDAPTTRDDLKDHRVARWIVSHAGTAFAYIQDYTVHGWPNHPFYDLPKGARGIDQFIGQSAMTGQGHGPAFITQHLHVLFAAGAPAVATDPHPDNARAISAYQKAGFTAIRPAEDTPWGRILPMVRYNPSEARA